MKQTRIHLICRNGADLLGRYFPNGKLGGLFVETLSPLPLGTQVTLLVSLNAAQQFEVEGTVTWSRVAGTDKLKAGYGVELAEGQQAARDRLLAVATGRVDPRRARAKRRINVELPVRVEGEGRVVQEVTGDLSQGGVFVRSEQPLPPGCKVEVSLRPPLTLRPIRVSGKVAWQRREGPHAGMGIEFLFDDAAEAPRIEALVRKLEPRED